MRVYELAKQLDISNKELIAEIRALGIEVKSHSSSITDEEVRQVMDALGKSPAAKKPAPDKSKSAKKSKAEKESKPEKKPAKLDARAIALQALERAKAKRAQQHQAMMQTQAEAEQEKEEGNVVAPEYQKVQLGSKKEKEAPKAQDIEIPEKSDKPQETQKSPEAAQAQTPPPPKTKSDKKVEKPKSEAPKEEKRPVKRQKVVNRNIQLEQLPGLPKRKKPEPKPSGDQPADLSQIPQIDVMKMRPARKSSKHDHGRDREDEKPRKRPKMKGPKGEKKIRPGRFLSIASLEDTANGMRRKTKGGGHHHEPKKSIEKTPDKVKIYGEITVGEFAEKINVPATEIITRTMALGDMLTINNLLTSDMCDLLAADLDIEIEVVPENDETDVAEIIEKREKADAEETLRPPVVTVMGHVDHGKTSLLDTIRKTDVAEGEYGGITQHIGAYQVETEGGIVTFLDTPGHAAFTAMRARGAQVTDIVILIVAADDGLMPQTIEAINHARAAEVPIVVAINKIDLPGANIQKVKNELMQHELIGEDLGGDTIICEVSAKTGEGVDNLLEMLLLQSEILELKAAADIPAEGVVIESEVDPQTGIRATILVKSGTLHKGDVFVCGDVSGRVRLMIDDRGNEVDAAPPAFPVEIFGLDGCPDVGEKLLVMDDERHAREIAETREQRRRRKEQNRSVRPHVTLEGLSDFINEDDKPKELHIILKADVQGSVEAVRDAMERLSTEKVTIRIIHGAVGAISESDVQLAMASDAIIIGFNVRADGAANDLASQEGIDIKTYRVIYELLEDLSNAMLGMLDKKFKEVTRGQAEIREIFKISRLGNIAGCFVTQGSIQRNDNARLMRDGTVVYEGKFSSLRRVKDDVREVNEGYECGITLENYQDIKQGDIIEAFYKEEVEQTL